MKTKNDWENLFNQNASWPVDLNPAKHDPANLYHYTGATGVLGILSSRSLWATNFSFLNDPSEISYGRNLIFGTIQRAEKLRCDLKGVISRKLDASSSEVYVCCFTKCRDDLSQWRAYGTPMTVRYCIGFDLEAIGGLAEMNSQTEFRKVIYEEQEQRKAILRVIEAAITTAEKYSSRIEEIGNLAADRLARLLPALKSPAYAAEEEWRVIRWIRNGDDMSVLDFDAARGVIRPYITFNLNPFPIVELIILAPGRESAAVKAASMLLQKADIGNVKAEHSRIPFAE